MALSLHMSGSGTTFVTFATHSTTSRAREDRIRSSGGTRVSAWPRPFGSDDEVWLTEVLIPLPLFDMSKKVG